MGQYRRHWSGALGPIIVLSAAVFAASAATALSVLSSIAVYSIIVYLTVRAVAGLVDWYFDRFYVTSSRAIDTFGIWGGTMQSIPVRSITNIDVARTSLGQLIGMGTVRIESHGFRGFMALRDVGRPDKLVRDIVQVQERLQGREMQETALKRDVIQVEVPPAEGGTGAQSRTMPDPAHLERLARMHAQGLLTDREYAAAKAELMRRLHGRQ